LRLTASKSAGNVNCPLDSGINAGNRAPEEQMLQQSQLSAPLAAMSFAKELGRAVLPRAAQSALGNGWRYAGLLATRRREFDGSSLRNLGMPQLEAMWSDPGTQARWSEDERLIATVLPAAQTPAGVNPGDRRALYHMVRALAPETVLEVGTNVGASTLHIAMALRSLGSRRRMTTIDILDVNDGGPTSPWRQAGLPLPPRAALERLGLTDLVTFRTQPGEAFLAGGAETFDLIFLDGDHAPRAVYREVAAALRRLRSGGTIVLHDYYPENRVPRADVELVPGPWQAGRRIMREAPGIRILPLGELPWETKPGLQRTSLALVLRPWAGSL
jgi:predicted O-methyltransferase YrrM